MIKKKNNDGYSFRIERKVRRIGTLMKKEEGNGNRFYRQKK